MFLFINDFKLLQSEQMSLMIAKPNKKFPNGIVSLSKGANTEILLASPRESTLTMLNHG